MSRPSTPATILDAVFAPLSTHAHTCLTPPAASATSALSGFAVVFLCVSASPR